MSGFIGDMVGSVKNNRRSKKSAFAKWRKFEKQYTGGGHLKKNISSADRAKIRQQIKKENRKKMLFNILMVPVSVAVLALVFWLVVFILNYGS